MVRTHPETKRRCLYVNRIFTSHIEGPDREESDDLLDFLYREVEVPQYQVRFKWAANSVAFWDDRSTQHLAISDYWPRKRVMERLTIIGDRRSASLAFRFFFLVLDGLDHSVGFQIVLGRLP
jgi:taurine dioxygenase